MAIGDVYWVDLGDGSEPHYWITLDECQSGHIATVSFTDAEGHESWNSLVWTEDEQITPDWFLIKDSILHVKKARFKDAKWMESYFHRYHGKAYDDVVQTARHQLCLLKSFFPASDKSALKALVGEWCKTCPHKETE